MGKLSGAAGINCRRHSPRRSHVSPSGAVMLTHRAATAGERDVCRSNVCCADRRGERHEYSRHSCIDGQRHGSTMERALHDRQLRQPKGRHQCGRAPTRVRLQRRIRVCDRLLVGQVRRHRTRRSGPYEPLRPAAAAVHLDRNPLGVRLRLELGLLPGRRDSDGVEPGEIIGPSMHRSRTARCAAVGTPTSPAACAAAAWCGRSRRIPPRLGNC